MMPCKVLVVRMANSGVDLFPKWLWVDLMLSGQMVVDFGLEVGGVKAGAVLRQVTTEKYVGSLFTFVPPGILIW